MKIGINEGKLWTMSQQITFLHAADLHLDSPFKGLSNIPEHLFNEIVESTFTALDRLVQTAIDKQVDFVLLVGDLFDNDVRGLRAQIKLRNALEKLKKYHIIVYICYGNHDYIKGNIHHVAYPDNVYIFTEETVSHFTYWRNNKPLANVYGFSYENRAITSNKARSYYLVGEHIPFHIAMLHGSYQKNTSHDMYAPFAIHDLMKEDFNYWALGHIHQREIIKQSPPVVYPGNTQGRHRKETGEKGCYYVELTETGARLDFIPLHAIAFQTLTMNISTCKAFHEVEKRIEQEVSAIQFKTPVLISLIVEGASDHLFGAEHGYLLQELVELVNESTIHQTHWRFIYQCEVKKEQERDQELFVEKDYFIGELTQQMEQLNITSVLSELYNHRQAKKYIESIHEIDEQELKREAYDLLRKHLMLEGGD